MAIQTILLLVKVMMQKIIHFIAINMKKIAILIVIFYISLTFSNKITNKLVWLASTFDYDKNWTVYDLGVNKSNKFGILMDK